MDSKWGRMARFELILRKKPNSKGLLPITLKITTSGDNPSFIYLGFYIDQNDWDEKRKKVKKSHPNWVTINNYILKRLSDATDQGIEAVTKKKIVSSRAIKQKIAPPPSAQATIFSQIDSYLENLVKSQKFNEYGANKPRLLRFKEYLKRDHRFDEITIAVLEDFKSHIKSEFKVGNRTLENYMSAIRSVYGHAVKQEIIERDEHYPFGKKGIKIKFPETGKIGLTFKELQRLKKVELTGRANHARNLWLFSYYFAGMRAADVFRLRWSDFIDGRLYYRMGKNDKLDSIKVAQEAQDILNQYKESKEHDNDLVFPELKGLDLSDEFNTHRVICFKTSAIDKILRTQIAPAAKINKTLTMHISRHTFAQMAGDKIPVQILQQLYRHNKIETTIGYQSNFINNHKDEALEKVLNIQPS